MNCAWNQQTQERTSIFSRKQWKMHTDQNQGKTHLCNHKLVNFVVDRALCVGTAVQSTILYLLFLLKINLRIRKERTLCFDLRMIFSRPRASDVTGDSQLMTTYDEYGLQRRRNRGMRNDFIMKVLKSTID